MAQVHDRVLEKAFSDLAYTTLRDKAPGLIDYLVGFQLLDSDEDGSRAVGMFGVEVANDFYYIPCFFLNGQIKGMDSIYGVKTDLFVPLDEKWVDNLIQRRPVELGKVNDKSKAEMGELAPNYQRLKVIPGGTGGMNLKLGQAVVDAMSQDSQRVGEGLVEALRAAGAVGWFKTAMDRFPSLREGFERHYSLFDLESVPVVKRAAPTLPDITIISNVTDAGVDQLTDAERDRILRGEVVVKDNRPEINRSILYTAEQALKISNPTNPGLYDAIFADGHIEPIAVLRLDSGRPEVLVYRKDGRHGTLTPTDISVVREYPQAELNAWLDGHSTTVDKVKPGQSGTFYNQAGVCTVPLCINQVTTGKDDIKVLDVRDRYYGYGNGAYPHGYNGNPAIGQGRHLPFSCNQIAKVVLGGRAPVSRQSGDEVVISPVAFRFLQLNQFREVSNPSTDLVKDEVYLNPRESMLLGPADFGNPNTIIDLVKQASSELTVWRNGQDITIRSDAGQYSGFDKVAQLDYLLGTEGLSVEDSERLLGSATHQPTTFYVSRPATIKSAAQMLDFPELLDETQGNDMNQFVRGTFPFNAVNQRQPEDNSRFYLYNSPFSGAAGDDQARDTVLAVDRAEKLESKEVFDAAAIGSLINAHSPTEFVERFLPTISAGMDRIGRWLFMVHWHYDQFKERYGDTELDELIDNLRSCFEQVGDVVMFAKRRTLAGDPEHYGIGLNPIFSE